MARSSNGIWAGDCLMSDDTFNEMADEILALRARVAHLEEALRDVQTVCHASNLVAPEIQQVYRIAAAALTQGERSDEEEAQVRDQ
jgi:hypothetical protein